MKTRWMLAAIIALLVFVVGACSTSGPVSEDAGGVGGSTGPQGGTAGTIDTGGSAGATTSIDGGSIATGGGPAGGAPGSGGRAATGGGGGALPRLPAPTAPTRSCVRRPLRLRERRKPYTAW